MNESPGLVVGLKGLFVDTPLLVAARSAVSRRLQNVIRMAEEAAGPDNKEATRRLRVATRRATAALDAFQLMFDRSACKETRRVLRGIRRSAAARRQNEVFVEHLIRDRTTGCIRLPPQGAELLDHFARSTSSAGSSSDSLPLGEVRSLNRLRKRLVRSIRSVRESDAIAMPNGGGVAPYTLGELGAVELPPLLADVRAVTGDQLQSVSDLHRLRIAIKKLRYALEIFAACFPAVFQSEIYPLLEEVQDRLGEINDLHEIAQETDHWSSRDGGCLGADGSKDGGPDAECSNEISAHYRAQCDYRIRDFVAWWGASPTQGVFQRLETFIHRYCVDWASMVRTRRVPGATLATVGPSQGNGRPAAGSVGHRRVAAIDVGTNSIRLTVAETDPQCGFRVIEDMKETTRLGTGVYTEGRLKSGAVDRSLTALERMRAVAEGHHVDRLRAVGTSAIREAANSREFLDLARRQAGVHIEVIDADREARLAFSSVASAFELSDTRMAVADLGGGSMELIFGSGGVVDAVYALPLGAVRLTERHLGDGGAGQGHEEMVHAIDRVLDEIIGKPIYKPDLLIGTGGTFTCLAKVGILRGAPSGGAGRFPFAVRGYQLRRKEISALLEWLREMSPEQRREVPGLSSQRSEIIVAGVCVIERVLRYLKIDRLRVHDGGIRDGLLAELIDELSFDPRVFRPEITGVVPSARAFAERCRFEKPHSEHVAALALEIFDQLSVQVPDASGTWARRECRELLHAAGLVHDVGILIAWKRHHRHGSDMIVHGDLPGLSRREIEVLACAARYHRKSGPRLRHASFRKLGDDDQRLVRHLVGILRIADGLDRLHSQNVRGVRVEAEPGRVRFEVMADERPGVNLRYARAKADVFESAFHVKTDFTWAQADAAPTSTEIDP